jgi:hypothetical protein
MGWERRESRDLNYNLEGAILGCPLQSYFKFRAMSRRIEILEGVNPDCIFSTTLYENNLREWPLMILLFMRSPLRKNFKQGALRLLLSIRFSALLSILLATLLLYYLFVFHLTLTFPSSLFSLYNGGNRSLHSTLLSTAVLCHVDVINKNCTISVTIIFIEDLKIINIYIYTYKSLLSSKFILSTNQHLKKKS